MPLPKPETNEKYKHFVKRFLTNEEVKKEYPDYKQRFAIMLNIWRQKNENK